MFWLNWQSLARVATSRFSRRSIWKWQCPGLKLSVKPNLMNHPRRFQRQINFYDRVTPFAACAGEEKSWILIRKNLQFRSSKHLWFLFLSQELGENRQRTSLFSCMTSYLHIFVRPDESKSGTSFKVSYNRTRNNELSWSGHSEFTIKLRGMGRRVCLLSKLENTCLSKRKCCASFPKPIDENGSHFRISGTGCKGDYRQSKAEPM